MSPKTKKTKPKKLLLWDRIFRRFLVNDELPDVVVVFALKKTTNSWDVVWEAREVRGLTDEHEGALPKGVGGSIIAAVREQLGEEFFWRMYRTLEPDIQRVGGQIIGMVGDAIGRRINRRV